MNLRSFLTSSPAPDPAEDDRRTAEWSIFDRGDEEMRQAMREGYQRHQRMADAIVAIENRREAVDFLTRGHGQWTAEGLAAEADKLIAYLHDPDLTKQARTGE